jgi:hypothetical protein
VSYTLSKSPVEDPGTLSRALARSAQLANMGRERGRMVATETKTETDVRVIRGTART